MKQSDPKPSLKIIAFRNRGGTLSSRVTGTVGEGDAKQRMQKNFPTREEAEVFMDGLIDAADQGESSPTRPANTIFPTNDELREAELAWKRLRAKLPEGSLVTAVDYYLEHAGKVIKDGEAKQILDDFIEARRLRGNHDNTLAVAKSILSKFLRVAGIKKISEFTQERATMFVLDESVGLRTRRDRKDQLYNFAKFLLKNSYLAENVVDVQRRASGLAGREDHIGLSGGSADGLLDRGLGGH